MIVELVVFECLLAFFGISLVVGEILTAAVALLIANLLALHIFRELLRHGR
jgi:hypothetical protein